MWLFGYVKLSVSGKLVIQAPWILWQPGCLCFVWGQATRLIEYAMPGHKVYRVTLRFGTATDTHDAEGRVTSQQNASHLTAEFIKSLLPAFRGEILQRPPAFFRH